MGHAATPRKLFQFHLRDTPFCDCDGIQMGDVNHIFLGCSKNTRAIDLFYSILDLPKKYHSLPSMQLILAYFNPDCHESEIQEAIIRLLIGSKLYI